MKTFGIIIITFLLSSHMAYSCDKEKKVPDCSEQSWNPSSKNTPSTLNRFYQLDSQITKLYQKGDFIEAKKLALEYLALADNYKNNWNYGNAIHDANRILGLISYQKGNYEEAATYLIKAGKSTGSPQLDTFGPELDLANLLLKKEKVNEVKTYLVDVKTFWKMDNGILDEWIESIAQNKTPELSRFGDFRMSIYQKIFYWLILTWPIVISIAFVFIYKRKKLSPIKFIPAAILAGYVVLIIASFISNFLIAYLMGVISISFMNIFIYTITAIAQLGLPLLTIYFLSNIIKLKIKN